MLFEIKHRFTGSILFSLECGSLKLCVEAAIKIGADLRGASLRGASLRGADLSDASLRGADLSDADLRGASLRGADLSDADLRGADLSGADLSDASLRGADLSGADLRGASLRGADLSDADLRGADLSGADLRGASLRGASLRGADLSDADLTPIRDDLWSVLAGAPREADGLRAALIEGRVDGSTYSGECACLVGTIANLRHVYHDDLGAIKPNSNRPIERFFMSISKGDTPDTNQACALAVQWTDEFLFNMRQAFGAKE
jgi:hypothetical protein